MRRAALLLLVLLLATPGAPTPQATAPDPAAERARDLVERVLAAPDEGARAALLEAAGLDAGVLGSSFLDKARALLDAGDTDPADLSFGYALRLAQEDGDRKAEASVRNSRSRLLRQRGEHDAALEELARAEAIAVELGDVQRQAGVLNNQAVIHRALGDYDEALALYERSLALLDPERDRQRAALAFNNIGVVHMNRGDNRRALLLFERSLAGLAADDPFRSNNYANMGQVHEAQGDLDLAADYYARALATDESSGRHNQLPYDFLLMGDLDRRRERLDEAEQWFRKALAGAERVQDAAVEAGALTRLGELALARGEPGRALEWMERGRARAEGANEIEELTRALTGLARAQLASGRADEGLAHARAAIALAERMHALFLLWEARTVLGRLHAAAGERDEARRALEAGVAAIEEWREHVAGEEGPARFLEDKLEPYHALVELEVASGRPEEAIRWAERAHARTLTDVLRRGGGLGGGPLDDAQAGEERRLERRLAQLHSRRAALNRESDAAEARAQELAIQAARRELAAFRARVEAGRPVLRLADDSPAGDPLAGLGSLLGPGSVLLLYAATPGSLHLFAVTADRGALQVEHHALPVTARVLADRVESFRRRVAERDLRVRTDARELHRLVMGAAAARLHGRDRVVIVPDGPLWELPFAVLVGDSGRYLMEDASLSYAPSLLALTLPGSGPLFAGRGAPRLLAVGNPAAPTAAVGALAPLRSAEHQARALGRLYGRGSSVLVGTEALEERVRVEAPRFDVLHFATHGLLDDGSPLFSYLALAGAGDEPERDGRLEAREVMRLRLPARLVVLSACESGRGRVNAGEGIIGLSWAFALAGSPAIVASHWQVDAQGTGDLMLALHRGLLDGRGVDGGVDVAGRLRAAALALMRNPRYRHPFYWGGFFVMGRSRI